ncbi:hypothetical protein [Krasilnikovia sp. MM14-A1004]|uniref:hypothetical protein n=1 Tax=Krasilnikovia sp. MM14-A1004 TaxID=3373541 RepID=UPI00399C9878
MTSQQDTAVSTGSGERAPFAGIALAAVGLLWMAGMLWSARATVTGRTDAESEVVATAYALPGIVSAALVAGATGALAVLGLFGRRARGAGARFAVTIGTGLALGALGAVPIITINTAGWVYAVAGGTVAAAATIGGALAGFREPRVVAAACWGAIAVFVVGFALNVAQVPLLEVFGAGSTSASQTSAAGWFSLTQSVLGGLAAGVVSFRVLRRSAAGQLRWPMYALAGAGPGLLLALTEILARTAGARVLELAGRVSELELTVQRMLGGARLNNALIVLFAGAISAIVLFGRTLGPVPGDEDAPAESEVGS